LSTALDEFQRICSRIGGVEPDRSFSAWADDRFLASGVAINPGAAAHCVTDYRRTVVFMRGLHAALQAGLLRFPDRPLRVLYAGCGPYATLLLPLLQLFAPTELEVYLLDVHQRSLDCVRALLAHFELGSYRVCTVQADASSYRHPERLHLIVAEAMQKSLEQEPQVAVTCNLAPQLCAKGLFLPRRIDVDLGLVEDTDAAQGPRDYAPLARVFTLDPAAAPDLAPITVTIPSLSTLSTLPTLSGLAGNGRYSACLFTRIQVFGHFSLAPWEAEISLPRPCPELSPLCPGETFEICYQPGSYPMFRIARASSG
jgi:hypothetical protein